MVKNDEETTPKETIVRANFTGQTDLEAFGPAFLYEEPEMFEEKMQIPIHTNSRVKYESSEDEDDNEGYDPTDICYECGKNLKGEYQCKRCYSPDTTEDDYEEHDPTDICFECGKNLRGENQCKRCFIPNTVEDEPEEDDDDEIECAFNRKAQDWLEERFTNIIDNCDENQDLIKKNIDTINENIDELDIRTRGSHTK